MARIFHTHEWIYTWGFLSVMWSSMCFVHGWLFCSHTVLCETSMCFARGRLLCSNSLLEHLAQCLWTSHMDEHEMWFSLSLSYQLPPRPMVIQRHYSDLIRSFVVLTKNFLFLFFFSLGHASRLSWLTCWVDCVFQKVATCLFLNGWHHFVDPISGPYK